MSDKPAQEQKPGTPKKDSSEWEFVYSNKLHEFVWTKKKSTLRIVIEGILALIAGVFLVLLFLGFKTINFMTIVVAIGVVIFLCLVMWAKNGLH